MAITTRTRNVAAAATVAVAAGLGGFWLGNLRPEVRGHPRPIWHARELVDEITEANATAVALGSLVAKVESDLAETGGSHVPFDACSSDEAVPFSLEALIGYHSVSGFAPRSTSQSVFAYADRVAVVNAACEALTRALRKQARLQQWPSGTDVRWAVLVESGRNGRYASLSPLKTSFAFATPPNEPWPDPLVLVRGEGTAAVARFAGGRLESQGIPLEPAANRTLCGEESPVRTRLASLKAALSGVGGTDSRRGLPLTEVGENAIAELMKLGHLPKKR